MVLKSFVDSLDAARTCLTYAKTSMEDARLHYCTVSEKLENKLKECRQLEDDIEGGSEIVSSVEDTLEKVWKENPHLKEQINSLYKRHYDMSKKCKSHREMADKLFSAGEITESQIYRKLSLHEKDQCIVLQDEISGVESVINESLAYYEQPRTYREYRIALTKLRRLKREYSSLKKTRIPAIKDEEERARRAFKACKEHYQQSENFFENSWKLYREVALEVAKVPAAHRNDAKVTYQNESNQTKVIFGDSPTTDTHGHIQIDNAKDKIIYYRLPDGRHGGQNFTGEYKFESPSKTSAD